MEQKEYWKKVIRTINLFKRFSADELTDHEKEIIENWNPDVQNSAFDSIDIDSKTIEEHGKRVKKRVFDHIGNPIPKEKKNIVFSGFAKYASIAAMVALLIGGAYLLFNINSTPIQNYASVKDLKQLFAQTTNGETKEITLPDGTVVKLNANTQLELIQSEFGQNNREIWLNGEAFFKVHKDATKPFIIHSGEIITTVKGTSFNVKAYAELNTNVVSVREGKVEISDNSGVLGLLTANQQLIYNINSKAHEIETSNWEDAAGWTDGHLVLNYADAAELKLRVKQKFNMNLDIQTNALDNIRMRSIFNKDTNIDDLMKSVCGLYNLKYDITTTNIKLYK